MRTIRTLAYVLLSLSVVPTTLLAQGRKEVAEYFVKDVLSSVFGPNGKLSLHAGSNSHGRFLLQRMTLAGGAGGERVVRSQVFDVDDIGELQSHSVSIQLLRYMLPSTADEPTRVNRSSIRCLVVYYSGNPDADLTNARRAAGRR